MIARFSASDPPPNRGGRAVMPQPGRPARSRAAKIKTRERTIAYARVGRPAGGDRRRMTGRHCSDRRAPMQARCATRRRGSDLRPALARIWPAASPATYIAPHQPTHDRNDRNMRRWARRVSIRDGPASRPTAARLRAAFLHSTGQGLQGRPKQRNVPANHRRQAADLDVPTEDQLRRDRGAQARGDYRRARRARPPQRSGRLHITATWRRGLPAIHTPPRECAARDSLKPGL